MRIEQLQYFLDLVRTKSFTSSARRLYISQQGLSRAIQSLENEFDIQLFTRQGNKILLTDIGLEFGDYAEKIVETYQEMRECAIEFHCNTSNGNCNIIYVIPYILHNVFPFFQGKIEAYAQKLNITFLEEYHYKMLQKTNSQSDKNRSEIYLTALVEPNIKKIANNKTIVFDEIYRYQTIAKVAKDSYFANKEYITLEELATLPIIHYDDDLLTDLLYKIVDPYGKPNIFYMTKDRGELRKMIFQSKLIGLASDVTWKMLPEEDFIVIPIKDALFMHIGFMYKSSAIISNDTLEFMRYCNKLVKTTLI